MFSSNSSFFVNLTKYSAHLRPHLDSAKYAHIPAAKGRTGVLDLIPHPQRQVPSCDRVRGSGDLEAEVRAEQNIPAGECEDSVLHDRSSVTHQPRWRYSNIEGAAGSRNAARHPQRGSAATDCKGSTAGLDRSAVAAPGNSETDCAAR
ncbi:MAG: hypothetical protein ACXW2U_08890 [Telluria sp.]